MSATTVDPSADLDAPVDVRAEVHRIKTALAALAPEVVPERIPAHRLAVIDRDLGCIERQAAGMRLVLAKAVADTGAWRGSGARSAEEHRAKQNGTSVAKERADIKASERLEDLPATREAASSGKLSPDKTKAVVEGATADPDAEKSLLETAANGDLQDVRDEARRVRQRVDERDGNAAERMYERRSLRMWLNLNGEGQGVWSVPPEYQAWFMAMLEPYRQEAFRLARESGQRVPPEALMADAMFMLARDVLGDLDLPTPPPPPYRPDQPRPQDGDPSPDAGPSNDKDSAVPPAQPDTDDRTDVAPAPASGDGPELPDNADGAVAPVADDEAGGGDESRPAEGNDISGADSDLAPNLFGPSPGDRRGADDASSAAAATPDAATPNRRARRLAERRNRGGNRKAPAQINIHVDYDAFVRGCTLDGELCEIPGIGSVPVSVAQAMADDAILNVIVTGDDVTVISSHRRYIPAPLRRAVEARDRECIVPGCHVQHHLEIDHVHDFANNGPTSLDNLARLCAYHHHLKTHCGWRLVGRPTAWRLEPP